MLPLRCAPGSICILRLSAIGDVTHVLPVLRTLQHHWPETSLTWIVGRTEAPLVDDIEGVELIVVDKQKGLKSLRELRRKLGGRSFDVLLHMQASWRANLCSLALRAPVRLGFDRAGARNQQWMFRNAAIDSNPREHVLDGFLAFPRAMGLTDTILRWNLPIPPSAREFARECLPGRTPYLVLNPCSSVRIRNFRNWSVESYAEVIDYAASRHGMRAVLTGGPSVMEKEYAEAIISASKHSVINLVGGTSLKQLAAVLERAAAVIAPDTGPLHIANAVGAPVIGLYATSNPERTGPYLNRHLTVNRYPDAIREEFGKEVEDLPWGQRVRNPEAMSLISVEEVRQKLEQALQRAQANSI